MDRLAHFGVGAVLGTGLDVLHVRHGVLSYPRPFWATGQAVWVPALFGSSAVVFVAAARLLRNGSKSRVSWAWCAWDFAAFAGAYWCTAANQARTGKRVSALQLLAFAALYAARSAFRFRRPQRWRHAHALFCVAVGCLVEAALVRRGWFVHHRPEVARLPMWLPGLYLLVAPVAQNLDQIV